ncbi:hypothetical protein B0J11DRAFT_501208 [Dendryphion nanum]|uniref:Uncharacterized protein n=1 Tax=Dendryphion nanum TaxID=256645 RepID=A0A9P9J1T8_9PLEO|nr:hypothetical protein B0J11DRAFT_501208 [Dendryphion nanum]
MAGGAKAAVRAAIRSPLEHQLLRRRTSQIATIKLMVCDALSHGELQRAMVGPRGVRGNTVQRQQLQPHHCHRHPVDIERETVGGIGCEERDVGCREPIQLITAEGGQGAKGGGRHEGIHDAETGCRLQRKNEKGGQSGCVRNRPACTPTAEAAYAQRHTPQNDKKGRTATEQRKTPCSTGWSAQLTGSNGFRAAASSLLTGPQYQKKIIMTFKTGKNTAGGRGIRRDDWRTAQKYARG